MVQLPLLQGIFDTVSLDATQWGICVGAAVAYLLAEELRRLVDRVARGRAGRGDESLLPPHVPID